MPRHKEPTGWELGLGISTVILGGALLLTKVIDDFAHDMRKEERAAQFRRTKQILTHAATDTAHYQVMTTGPDTTTINNKAVVHYHLTSDELAEMGVQVPKRDNFNPRP